jgi:integrase
MAANKNTILRKQWPRVRWQFNHGRRQVIVDARPTGRREFWNTPAEALASAEAIARQRANEGAASFAELEPAERRDAAEALSLLNGRGTLLDAARAFVTAAEYQERQAHVPTVSEAINAYLTAKRQEEACGELSRLTMRELRGKMRLIGAAFGERKVTELDEAAIRDFLRKLPQRPRTKHNIKTKLGQFLNFCRREGKWIQSNPIESVKVKIKSHDVEILSLDELKRLITAAVTSEHSSVVVPFIAVQLFAGLRPYEAQYLQWSSIHFETAQIEIKAATSKTRESRFVPMEPLLTQALLPYRQVKGTIIGPRFRRTLKEVKIAAGFGPGGRAWPVDVLRHCYGSYWLAVHRDRAHLAELMGNSLAVIKTHYRRAIPPQIAHEYWQLSFSLPQTAKIIPIRAAGS